MFQSKKFDNTLKPLIPITRSCNSLLRQIKYNLLPEETPEIKSEDNSSNIQNLQVVNNSSNDTHTINNKVGESSDCQIVQDNENLSASDKKSIEEAAIENKQNENEPIIKVLKTVHINSESSKTMHQTREDEGFVNNKMYWKIDSSKHTNEDSHKVDSSSSSNNRMECSADSTSSHTYSAGCSYISTKGSKRNKPTTSSENETSKRLCRTKSKHEKNVMNGNQNQNIDFDCQNSNHENISGNTLSNDISSLEHSMNSQDINGVSRLKNESTIKENKWVTKASHTVVSASKLKPSQSNFSNGGKDKNIKNCISKVTELNSHQDGISSLSNEIQWPLKLSSCGPDSPESKPLITSSEQNEMEATSSDTEGNSSPKTEHILSLRNSEEIISNVASSRRSINENESPQIYAVSMDQKLTHIEHPYVENAVNSSTRDLEVVNVLSPVSINSTDIPMNKSAWVPDISLAHSQNDHNDVDGDHSQSSVQLNSLCSSNNTNTSRVANLNSEVEHISFETPRISRTCHYSQIESRICPDDSYPAALSPNENSVLSSAYGPAYDVNRLPLAVTVNSIPVTVSSKNNILHKLNDSSNSIYHGNTINLSCNGLKKKSILESQPSYNFTISKTMPTDMSTVERVSPSNKDINDIAVVSDGFSDVDSMDLRINSTESKETNSCSNNLPMSSLIPADLKSINMLNSFDKSSSWCTLKNSSDPSNLRQKQKLKIYSDPTKLISSPVNLNTPSGLSINLNEAHVQKVFLGNKSPSQVYFSPLADFCVSSDVDMKNHGNVEESKKNHFKNRPSTRECMNTCPNDKYIHSVLQPSDNDPNVKQTLFNSYDSGLTPNSQIVNNGIIYKFPRSESNSSVRYESSLQLQHKNPDCLSPHSGLTYTSFDPILGPSLLEDPNKKEEPAIINMTHLMLQSSKNCKVHYKWPLNKNKNQTASNGKIQETSQNLDYKNNSNVLYKYTDDELNQICLQNVSPNELQTQNSGLSFNERKNDNTYQSNQQFQDISNLIASDLSPTIQSGSESIEEKKQIQPRVINSLECNTHKEPADHQESMHRNAKMSSQSKETSTTLGIEVFEAAHHLFNSGKLFLCMYPKCTNSHHFRVLPSNAEMLRHEFTVPFDDFRFNIQYKYKQLLTSNPRTWPCIPELVQLAKRCLCEICGDFDSKLNQNQDMLYTYVEGKKPNIEEDNNENEQPTNPQIRLSWKKNLAHRFTSEAVEKQSISQMVEDMERHVNRFTHAFTIIFTLNKDSKTNLQNLQNACESYSDSNDNVKSLSSECLEKLEIGHKRFNKDIRLHSYQYLQLPSKVIPKYVLEELSNAPYQPPNQNVLNSSHQFDEEHFPNEVNRYFVKNSPSSSYPSVSSNITSQSLKYIHESIPNTSRQSAVENPPSTSRQSSVGIGNLTSSHQPILNNFPTSHGISIDSCTLNDRSQNTSHMSRYYSDGQMYTEFPHAYLQVPNAQFPNSSTNSYYGSPVNMPSDNSVPFCSPSLSINSVPNSPSSDCSIPSLVETVATAVPEHALLDDSLEAVNAAHNLMLISNRHRYNSTTSITTTNTTNTITVATTAITNVTTVTRSNIFTTDVKANNISTVDITTSHKNISPPNTIINNISMPDTALDTLQSTTELEDQETDIVHNSRRKKKKKHDKKKDKKKKGKR